MRSDGDRCSGTPTTDACARPGRVAPERGRAPTLGRVRERAVVRSYPNAPARPPSTDAA